MNFEKKQQQRNGKKVMNEMPGKCTHTKWNKRKNGEKRARRALTRETHTERLRYKKKNNRFFVVEQSAREIRIQSTINR